MRAKDELRSSQQVITTELYEHDEKMIVLRPGGGKTVPALTAIQELIRDNVIRHALIMAPKRVARSVWPGEIAEWEHLKDFTYEVLAGTSPQRAKQLVTASARELTIIGLDIVTWLLDQLAHLADDHPLFDLLVIDEISKFRDPTGTRVQALAKVIHRWRMVWGLTGTLRPSGPLDLFMPSRLVTRGKLWGKSFYKWQKANFYPIDRNQYDWKPFPGHEEKLNNELAPLVCIPELPPQPQPTIVIDRIELPDGARKHYREMENKMVTADVRAGSAAIATGKLAQIANGFIYDDDSKARIIHDEKRDWLREIIENATGPTLLIYEFKYDFQIMRELLGENLPNLGGTQTPDARTMETIANWNAGKYKFMALHPASGGHGLNLQYGGADMAWISPTWSPELYEQTIARLNRPGQTRQVIVRVCTATGTVDEMKLDRVHHKMTAQDAFEKYMRHVTMNNAAA